MNKIKLINILIILFSLIISIVIILILAIFEFNKYFFLFLLIPGWVFTIRLFLIKILIDHKDNNYIKSFIVLLVITLAMFISIYFLKWL